MHIDRLELTNFMPHKAYDLALPKTGVVLIHGANGSGKSSFVEAVAYGLYGKTLRGTSPFSDIGGSVVLTGKDLELTRTSKKGKQELKFSLDGKEADKYGTSTKAQEALSAYVGSLDLWRKTHVFSSQDSDTFTGATDGDRKRLLESILGLGKFDIALELCRKDMTEKERTLASIATKLARARGILETEQRSYERAQATCSANIPVVDDAQLKKELAGIKAHIKEVQEIQDGLAKEKEASTRALWQINSEVEALQKKVQDYKNKICPTCGQALPVSYAQDDVAKAQAEVPILKAKQETMQKDIGFLGAKIATAGAQFTDLHNKEYKLTGDIIQASSARKAWEAALADKNRAALALEDAEDAVATLSGEEATVKASIDTLAKVELVLGLRGVRARVLGKALSGIEEVANTWLARLISRELTIKLLPYSEKKTGGISDSISLVVTGAGGGHGYKGASGGERRRIDIALLLALAEIAAAAHGVIPGTLFLDEIMDALDEDGMDKVVEVLNELARSRAVVIITHQKDLIASLQPVKVISLA